MNPSSLNEFLGLTYRSYKTLSMQERAKKYFNSKNEFIDVRCCATRAYRDLCRNLRGIGNMKSGERDAYKKETYTQIEKCIKGLQSVQSQEGYDEWHKCSCGSIKSIADKYRINERLENGITFSYGLAQKWINMTIKYVIMLSDADYLNTNNFNIDQETFSKVKKWLHIPIDSYILKAAAEKNSENEFALCADIAPLRNSLGGTSFYSETKSQPWSKMNCKDYTLLQENLRKVISQKYNGIYPFEWEAKAWLKQSELESKKKSAKKKG